MENVPAPEDGTEKLFRIRGKVRYWINAATIDRIITILEDGGTDRDFVTMLQEVMPERGGITISAVRYFLYEELGYGSKTEFIQELKVAKEAGPDEAKPRDISKRNGSKKEKDEAKKQAERERQLKNPTWIYEELTRQLESGADVISIGYDIKGMFDFKVLKERVASMDDAEMVPAGRIILRKAYLTSNVQKSVYPKLEKLIIQDFKRNGPLKRALQNHPRGIQRFELVTEVSAPSTAHRTSKSRSEVKSFML